MKITCILASYNRPRWVKIALASVASQLYRNYELIVVDESDLFDIRETCKQFSFPGLTIISRKVDPETRRRTNRLSVNINEGLLRATGDLVCYLADDDFLLPNWFTGGASFFKSRPRTTSGYGRLFYTRDSGMAFDRNGKQVFPPGPVPNPYCVLDHNQVMHRRFSGLPAWPEDVSTIGGPDAVFFRSVAEKTGAFYRIEADAAVKRMHGKNLQQQVSEYQRGSLPRERE